MALAAGLSGVAESYAETVIRYVPQADINVLDPIVNKSPVVTQYGYMVYDQLFAVDGNYLPRPQMVDVYTASNDGKSYRFTLRTGVKFHDGAPVRAADATTSIIRWAKGDPAGQKMMAAGMALEVVDDRTFAMTFEKPFRQAIEIMAKPSWPLFVYPERNNTKPNNVANTDAIGSGPFKFVHTEWKPGSKIVFVKNPDYVPRNEPGDGYAGGKVVKVDRVEWNIIPDANTAVSALRKGEVDIVESIPLDFAKALGSDPNVAVDVFNKIGLQAYLRFNNIQPPFNSQKIRQALLHMVNQEDYMRAMIGDEQFWRTCWAYMMCGSPNGSEVGADAYRKPDREKAKQLLKEAGYHGEKVVVLTSTGIFAIQDEGQVLVQELRAVGMNVEEQQMDFNTMLSRRLNTEGVEKGGWSIIPLWSFGPDLANPLTSQMLTAPCAVKGWPGWACSPKLESLVDEWALSEDDKAKRARAEEIQREAINLAATIPLGEFYQPVAYRKSLTGILTAPYPIMWNLEKR
jgi:peptide/nickel transport system substrate-binding protein